MPTLEITRDVPRWALPLTEPARYKGASGGRASGKSHWFAEEAVEAMVCDPTLRVVCIREVQRSLKFSAKSLVEAKIRTMGVESEFEILATEIRRRGGTGVMIFEGMQDHTAESIKSLEGFSIAWVEEAQSISQRSLSMLIPTIRTPRSELWFSWNPELATDPVDRLFAQQSEDMVHVSTTFEDNPFCPDEMHKEAARLKANDEDAYEHIWLGGYNLGGHGRVYSKFLNKPFPAGNVDESVVDTGGEIYVGQDFNVNPMASVIGVRVVDELHVLDSLELATSNTSEVAAEIKARYGKRKVIFCPDPAGNQRSTKTSIVGQTDFTILERAGFEVRAPRAHAPVVDRINNTNAMMFDAELNRRRVRIHPKARSYIDALANLTYKEGTSAPAKNGYTHSCDAGDYLLMQEFNVLAPKKGVWGRSSYAQ